MRALPSLVSLTTTSLDRSDPNSLSTLYRAAIGPVNTAYYLPLFEHFEAAGRAGPSWNKTACLCTVNWLGFRQMWGAALRYAGVVVGAVLLVLGLGRGLLGLSDIAQLCLLIAIAIVAFAVPGIWGNALLYQHVRKLMAQALAATATTAEACVLLNRQASSSERGTWLALANAVLAGAAIGITIAWPRTDNMTSRIAIGPMTSAAAARLAASAPASPSSLPAPGSSRASNGLPAARPSAALPAAPAAPPSAASAASPMPALAPAHAHAQSVALAASSAHPDLPAPAVGLPVGAASAPSGASSPAPATAAASRASGVTPAAAAMAASAPISRAPAETPGRLSAARDFSAQPAAAPSATTNSKPFPGYAINVGLFARDENAQKALAQLLKAGLPASAQELDSVNGKRTRVRVGPFEAKAQADAAADKIRSLKLEAQVFRQ